MTTLAELTDEQRTSYFKTVCESVGLNPRSVPVVRCLLCHRPIEDDDVNDSGHAHRTCSVAEWETIRCQDIEEG